jgi:hypothetical protein
MRAHNVLCNSYNSRDIHDPMLLPQGRNCNIFHVHNAIIACLTQLSMNFYGYYATQVEESDNHALFFECKRCHF